MTDVLKGDVTGPLSATRIPALRDSLDELIEVCTAMRDRLPEDPQEQPLTDAALRATPLPVEPQDPAGLLARLALMSQAKLTFTANGLRIDCGGSAVSFTNQTLAGVNGLGSNSQAAQSIQQSLVAYNTGYRAALVVTP